MAKHAYVWLGKNHQAPGPHTDMTPQTTLHKILDFKKIIEVVEEQANDEGLWFVAVTAPEAYLQQELRRLHAVIEGLGLEA